MDSAMAVAKYLAANGYGTVGTDIFASIMMDSPAKQISIAEYDGSQSPEFVFGDDPPPVVHPRIQIKNRVGKADGYQAAWLTAWKIYRAVSALVDVTLESEYYQAFSPMGVPEILERDSQERIVFVQNHAVVRPIPVVP
jgi:hypothetical protein